MCAHPLPTHLLTGLPAGSGDEDMEEAMARMGLLAMRSKKSVEADKAKALRAAMAAVEAKQAAALEAQVGRDGQLGCGAGEPRLRHAQDTPHSWAGDGLRAYVCACWPCVAQPPRLPCHPWCVQTRASAMAASPVQVTVNPTINPTIHFNPSTNISGSTAHGGASTNTVTGATASPSVAQTGSGDVAAATGAAAAGGAVSAPGGATSGAVGSGAASHEPAAVALSSQAPSYGFPAPTFGQAPGLPAMPVSYTAAPAAGPLPVVAPQLGPLQPVMTATGQIVYVPVQQPVPPQPLGSIASAPYPSAPPAPPPVAFATPAMADGCSA